MAEEGHHVDRSFISQSGAFHMNGAPFYNNDGNNIASSLNVLDDLAPAELEYLDGASTVVTSSKCVIADTNKDVATIRHLSISGNIVTGSTTLAEADLEKIDGITNGTVASGKACVPDTNKDLASLRNLGVTGQITIGSQIVAGSSTIAAIAGGSCVLGSGPGSTSGANASWFKLEGPGGSNLAIPVWVVV